MEERVDGCEYWDRGGVVDVTWGGGKDWRVILRAVRISPSDMSEKIGLGSVVDVGDGEWSPSVKDDGERHLSVSWIAFRCSTLSHSSSLYSSLSARYPLRSSATHSSLSYTLLLLKKVVQSRHCWLESNPVVSSSLSDMLE